MMNADAGNLKKTGSKTQAVHSAFIIPHSALCIYVHVFYPVSCYIFSRRGYLPRGGARGSFMADGDANTLKPAEEPRKPDGPELPKDPEEFDDEPSGARPAATSPNEPIPALRELQVQLVALKEPEKGAVQTGTPPGETVVLLQDPEGFAEKPTALSVAAYALASLFNGISSAREIATAFNAKYEQLLKPQQVLDLQQDLDKGLFLYSQRFERMLKRRLRGYLQGEIRPAIHAGSSYPVEPEALRRTIKGFFSAPDGPGALEKLDAAQIARTDRVRAVIMPHVDFRANGAGATYAHAYQELICNSQAELFVILGVAHQSFGNRLFYVSQKDFGTPLGLVKTNRTLAARLQAASDAEPAISELAHRTEHSVEFQALLLQALLAEHCKRPIEIVPVLCGPIEPFLGEGETPLKSPPFQKFVNYLTAGLEASKKKWCLLCSVDFSHVGPEFGHSTMITERSLPALERGDHRLLRCLERLDIDSFFREIGRTQNARHVDAVMAVLTMLEVCKGSLKSGRELYRGCMLKPGTHSAVTFHAMEFLE
jgi:AmmeMemoRadiSam system protein B